MNDAIMHLQSVEQNLQMLRAQKNAVQSKLLECDNALKEVTRSKTCYKFVGNIMVLADSVQVQIDLSASKERLLRSKDSLEKQETGLLEIKKKLETELLG
jgi:chaperonin cofactor prefoldin